MFKELQPIVARGNVAMMLAAEGQQLRVTIHQKDPKGAALPISLSIVASPEELDAELPAAIAQAAGSLAKPAPVAAQVQSQVENATAAAEKKGEKTAARKAASAKPPKPARAKAKPRPVSKARPVKPPRKPAKVAKPKAAAKVAKAPKPAAAGAGRATAEECLAEFKTLYAKHGNALNRETFLKHAKTARSFERRFGGWKQFVAAAGFTATPSAEKSKPPAADDRTLELPLDGTAATVTVDPSSPIPGVVEETSGEPGAGERLVTADDPEVLAIAAGTNTDPEEVARGLNEETGPLPDAWPFPTTESAPQQDGTDASGSRADDASPAADADTPSTAAQEVSAGNTASETLTAPITPAPAVHKGRAVRTTRGTPILADVDTEVEIGDTFLLPEYGRVRVVEYTDEEIIVESVAKKAEGVPA